MNMDVHGRVNVTKELHVGNDPLADGIITTEAGADLILAPGPNGDVNIQTSGTGNVVISNSVWPVGTTPVVGMFLGATSANTLAFQSFVWPVTASSDTLTVSQLNTQFPAVTPGQQVLGPTVLYQKVGPSDWRTFSGFPYVPVDAAGSVTMTGDLNFGGYRVTNLGAPVLSSDAATKRYVDDVAAGLNAHQSCETSTTVALPTCVYSNGSAGVGSTLTATANGSVGSIGGLAVVVGTRLLVKNQSLSLQNGIYVVTQLGSVSTPWILTRASDFDGSPVSDITAGDFVYIQEGTLAGTQWVQTNVGTGTSPDHIIVGTDGVTFTQLSGSGTYTGGAGISVSSNTISNTGVLSLSAGFGVTLSSSTGNITVSGTGGTVTSVAVSVGAGLSVSGSPVTTSGTISLTNTGVTSLAAGSNISVSASTGAVTVSLPATVSGLTSVTSANITSTNNIIRSVATGIAAAGTTLASATVLTKDINVVSSVPASSGVSLMSTSGGLSIVIINTGANVLNVYPNSVASQIDSLGSGTAFSLPVGAKIMFISVSANQWYTLNATYS